MDEFYQSTIALIEANSLLTRIIVSKVATELTLDIWRKDAKDILPILEGVEKDLVKCRRMFTSNYCVRYMEEEASKDSYYI
jgi:hypothetical protein